MIIYPVYYITSPTSRGPSMLRWWHSVSGSCWAITWGRGSSSRSSSSEWPWGLQASTCPPTWPLEAWVTPGSPRPTLSNSPTHPATVPVQAWPHHLPLQALSPPLSPQACPLSPLPLSSTCMAPPLLPLPPPPPPPRWWWETQTWWADSMGPYSALKCSTVPFSFPTQVLFPHPLPACHHTLLHYLCVFVCHCLCIFVTKAAQHYMCLVAEVIWMKSHVLINDVFFLSSYKNMNLNVIANNIFFSSRGHISTIV